MKLLNRSIWSHLIYSSLVLLIAIPVFYFIIQRIVREDVDESLQVKKAETTAKLKNTKNQMLNAFEPDISLIPYPHSYLKDSFYTIKIYDSISKENIPYRVLVSSILLNGTYYSLKLKNSLLDSEALTKSIVTVMAILILLIVAWLFIINRRVSKKIWRPFYSTLNKLRHYRLEKNDVVDFDNTDIDEFADLNTTISSLTKRNQQVYQSQKEFTENASHELQTPLAIFQGKLDLLMQTTPLNQEQAELIGDLANASQRLNKVNKSLLLLSKIENNQFPETENIAIGQMLKRLVDQYQFQIKKKNIILNAKYNNCDTIEANKMLTEILFNNLLSNAIRYTPKNGHIHLNSTDDILILRNSGIAKPLEPEKIFNRFHKESTDIQSIGLGLAIAKKITDLYKYNLSYAYTEGLHSFSIRF